MKKTGTTLSTNQKPKPIMTWSLAISRALGILVGFTLSSNSY